MSQLYPKRRRTRPVRSNSSWAVRYEHMVYEGGVSVSWTGYYRSQFIARLAAWYHQHLASYGGDSVELIDQRSGSSERGSGS